VFLRRREGQGITRLQNVKPVGEHLDAYLHAAGIEGDRKGPLYRAAMGKT
jgi:hypothetical protein